MENFHFVNILFHLIVALFCFLAINTKQFSCVKTIDLEQQKQQQVPEPLPQPEPQLQLLHNSSNKFAALDQTLLLFVNSIRNLPTDSSTHSTTLNTTSDASTSPVTKPSTAAGPNVFYSNATGLGVTQVPPYVNRSQLHYNVVPSVESISAPSTSTLRPIDFDNDHYNDDEIDFWPPNIATNYNNDNVYGTKLKTSPLLVTSPSPATANRTPPTPRTSPSPASNLLYRPSHPSSVSTVSHKSPSTTSTSLNNVYPHKRVSQFNAAPEYHRLQSPSPVSTTTTTTTTTIVTTKTIGPKLPPSSSLSQQSNSTNKVTKPKSYFTKGSTIKYKLMTPKGDSRENGGFQPIKYRRTKTTTTSKKVLSPSTSRATQRTMATTTTRRPSFYDTTPVWPSSSMIQHVFGQRNTQTKSTNNSPSTFWPMTLPESMNVKQQSSNNNRNVNRNQTTNANLSYNSNTSNREITMPKSNVFMTPSVGSITSINIESKVGSTNNHNQFLSSINVNHIPSSIPSHILSPRQPSTMSQQQQRPQQHYQTKPNSAVNNNNNNRITNSRNNNNNGLMMFNADNIIRKNSGNTNINTNNNNSNQRRKTTMLTTMHTSPIGSTVNTGARININNNSNNNKNQQQILSIPASGNGSSSRRKVPLLLDYNGQVDYDNNQSYNNNNRGSRKTTITKAAGFIGPVTAAVAASAAAKVTTNSNQTPANLLAPKTVINVVVTKPTYINPSSMASQRPAPSSFNSYQPSVVLSQTQPQQQSYFSPLYSSAPMSAMSMSPSPSPPRTMLRHNSRNIMVRNPSQRKRLQQSHNIRRKKVMRVRPRPQRPRQNFMDDALWFAESQQSFEYDQSPNALFVEPPPSSHSTVSKSIDQTVNQQLGDYNSGRINISNLFSAYKSPALDFDPFQVYDEVNKNKLPGVNSLESLNLDGYSNSQPNHQTPSTEGPIIYKKQTFTNIRDDTSVLSNSDYNTNNKKQSDDAWKWFDKYDNDNNSKKNSATLEPPGGSNYVSNTDDGSKTSYNEYPQQRQKYGNYDNSIVPNRDQDEEFDDIVEDNYHFGDKIHNNNVDKVNKQTDITITENRVSSVNNNNNNNYDKTVDLAEFSATPVHPDIPYQMSDPYSKVSLTPGSISKSKITIQQANQPLSSFSDIQDYYNNNNNNNLNQQNVIHHKVESDANTDSMPVISLSSQPSSTPSSVYQSTATPIVSSTSETNKNSNSKSWSGLGTYDANVAFENMKLSSFSDFDDLNQKNYQRLPDSTDHPFEESPIPVYSPVYGTNTGSQDQSLTDQQSHSSPIDKYLSTFPASSHSTDDNYYNNVARIPEKYLSKASNNNNNNNYINNNQNYNEDKNKKSNNNNNNNNGKTEFSSNIGSNSDGGGYSSGNYISNSIKQQNVNWADIKSSAGQLSQYDYLGTTKSPFSSINSATAAVSSSSSSSSIGSDSSIASNFPENPDIMRLIPTGSVETIPLPPKSEYDIPEIIHNGDHVVRVQKVPVKGIEDAYYNPEIPEDDHSATATTTPRPANRGGSRGTKTKSNGGRRTETSTARTTTTTSNSLQDDLEGNVNDVIEDDENDISSEQNNTDDKEEDKEQEEPEKNNDEQGETEEEEKKENNEETTNDVEEEEEKTDTESTTASSDSESSSEDSSEKNTSSENDDSSNTSNADEEDDTSSSSTTTTTPAPTTTTTTKSSSKPPYPMFPPPYPPFMFPPMFPPPYPPPPGFPPMPMSYMPYGPNANSYGSGQKYYPSGQYSQSYGPKPYAHAPVIYSKEPHPQPPAGPPYQHAPVIYSKQPHAQPPAGYPYKNSPVIYSKQPHQQPQSGYPYKQSPVVYSQPPAYPSAQSTYPYNHSPVSYAKQPPQSYSNSPAYPKPGSYSPYPRPTYPPNIAPLQSAPAQVYPPTYPSNNNPGAPQSSYPTYPPSIAPIQSQPGYPPQVNTPNNYPPAPGSNYYYPNPNSIMPNNPYARKSANYYQKPSMTTEVTKNIMICQNNCKEGPNGGAGAYGPNQYYRRNDNDETEIKADIFLGDTISQDSYDKPNYSQQLPEQQFPSKPEDYPAVQPNLYPTAMHPMPKPYDATKKSGIINSFKKNLAKILPNLKAHSGDPYPPMLDHNYRSPDGSVDMNEQTEYSPEQEKPMIIYPCDKNRIGKCVMKPEDFYTDTEAASGAASSKQPVSIPFAG